MSKSFSATDAPARQRTFYGEPQHDDSHVDDRDIFCEAESRSDEREMYVHTTHYAVADDDYATVDGVNAAVRVA
ncbi:MULTISPECIES: hypothetical protein [Haloferax]|uniref:Uncharacterized protein n=1 Tax=Haloferax marinum TaxID=2666143 RepID=A0A6A8G7E7_9EURY|nr:MULTISPECIES: hypothetical protein [Haloferax]KAB1197713.1 hypothetical protein Hfx1150_09340 [Haloferax sp. CBA1150]MRW96767.1 hypothetical protein [Haloferax marinum]